MKNKVCKKCNKVLPKGYKLNRCEACRNEQVNGIKKGLKVVATVASIVGVVAIKGKYDFKNK